MQHAYLKCVCFPCWRTRCCFALTVVASASLTSDDVCADVTGPSPVSASLSTEYGAASASSSGGLPLARSQDFVPEGPTWRGPKLPPPPTYRKHLRFDPLFFFCPSQFILYFLISAIKFYFIFPLGGGGGAWPRAPPPLAASLAYRGFSH